MGFWGRVGNKLSSGLSSGTRMGIKALGQVARVGNKVADVGEKVVGGVERVPILGAMVAPATAVARTGIGLVRQVASSAETGADVLREGESIIRQGASGVMKGDLGAIADAKRRGEDVLGELKHQRKEAEKIRDTIQRTRGR